MSNLEREISQICRKVVKEILLKPKADKKQKQKQKQKQNVINASNLEKYLGVQRFRYGLAEEKSSWQSQWFGLDGSRW